MRLATACAGGVLTLLLVGGTATASERAPHLTLDTRDPWTSGAAPVGAGAGATPAVRLELDRTDPWSSLPSPEASPITPAKPALDRDDPWAPASPEYRL